ncbi:uncharacterized protein LOC126482206 [Schistocerca serialis cubense]|uniref:uncharacterized protein LOC126482206 n=1 Tax=Schistocerca serialis cubense TaxID=2023355 RepID=UPI00214F2994|nr:uncharacterized protein LOC126482206 [Schistocerca serialis cubense]
MAGKWLGVRHHEGVHPPRCRCVSGRGIRGRGGARRLPVHLERRVRPVAAEVAVPRTVLAGDPAGVRHVRARPPRDVHQLLHVAPRRLPVQETVQVPLQGSSRRRRSPRARDLAQWGDHILTMTVIPKTTK